MRLNGALQKQLGTRENCLTLGWPLFGSCAVRRTRPENSSRAICRCALTIMRGGDGMACVLILELTLLAQSVSRWCSHISSYHGLHPRMHAAVHAPIK